MLSGCTPNAAIREAILRRSGSHLTRLEEAGIRWWQPAGPGAHSALVPLCLLFWHFRPGGRRFRGAALHCFIFDTGVVYQVIWSCLYSLYYQKNHIVLPWEPSNRMTMGGDYEDGWKESSCCSLGQSFQASPQYGAVIRLIAGPSRGMGKRQFNDSISAGLDTDSWWSWCNHSGSEGWGRISGKISFRGAVCLGKLIPHF